MTHEITHEHAYVIRAFLRRHHFLRSEAVRIWGSIDDAVQEIWLHCARVCSGWPENFKTTYLVWKTCEYRIRHERRKVSLNRVPKPRGEFFGLASPQPDTELDLSEQVERALQLVPERWANVLRRRYLQHETQVEIAADIGLSPQRIEQIEHQAIRKIRGAA